MLLTGAAGEQIQAAAREVLTDGAAGDADRAEPRLGEQRELWLGAQGAGCRPAHAVQEAAFGVILRLHSIGRLLHPETWNRVTDAGAVRPRSRPPRRRAAPRAGHLSLVTLDVTTATSSLCPAPRSPPGPDQRRPRRR